MKITRLNGNGQPYTVGAPLVKILANNINDVALQLIKDNTGLKFKKSFNVYECKVKSHKQLVTLLTTYNFKMWYHNNASNHNTIFLRFNLDDIIEH